MWGFLSLPRELRDLVYLDALSEDGKTIKFTWVDNNGQQMLIGPKVLSFLLSCRQVSQEMKDTMQNDLTIHLETGDVPTRRLLGKLHAREAKNLSISRFTSHTPLSHTPCRSYGKA